MEPRIISLTTAEIKKGKPDCKELPANILHMDDQVVVVLADRKQKLDKCQRIHPGIGNILRIDGNQYVATDFQEIGCPKHYMFVASPM